ncbi:hypothetical protein [Endozoicomonas sp.]|uniref:hypothetical protein n=1 Tax=Endozoicomonas sp. TaxID=1892382 RepID=UPI003AF5C34F
MVIAYDLGLFLANAKKLPFIKFDLVRKNKADCFAYLSYLKETIDNESVFLTMQNELLKNGVYKDLRIIEKIKIHLGLS